jgi:hypothetical protein
MKVFSFLMVLSLFIGAFAHANQGHIGEIRYSILSLNQFQELYGLEWELMKGQDIDVDSPLFHLWGKRTVPDARGIFLRCSNADQDKARGNPDGNLPVGDYQSDSFKKHNHGGGNHSHKYNGGNSGGTVFGDHTTTSHNYGNHNYGTSESGEILKSEGGSETRPRCIIVNAFIKLKEPTSPPPTQTQSITPQMMSELTMRPEFKQAVENAVREIQIRRNR